MKHTAQQSRLQVLPLCVMAFLLLLAFSEARAVSLIGVTASNKLVRFDSATPAKITASVAITGLAAGETLLGVDVRPANGKLYALGSSNRLYIIDLTTGAATALGTAAFTPALDGTTSGFDFNPVPDRIRIVSNKGQSLRAHPDTGVIAATDKPLNPGTPNVVAAAYTNNVAGTKVTTLYGIDATTDMLVRQGGVDGMPSPNDGLITPIGALGVDVTDSAAFDIESGTGAAYAALTTKGANSSQLYTIDLQTGAAKAVGAIGVKEIITGLSIPLTPPLFYRLGGQAAVEAVVKEFAGNVLADDRINKKFAKSDKPRLLKNLTDFVCAATGGPCKYTGLSMTESHKNMGTTAGEFNALVEDLVKALDKFKVPEKEKGELLAALGPLAPQIVENKSTETGTALPDAFKPAPPLPSPTPTPTPAPMMPPTAQKSLYERLGGQPAVEAVVKDFAERVLADTRINKKFAKSNAPRLLKNLTDFVCAAAGGPCKYNGLSMKESHLNMGTTQGEFSALVEDLVMTLDKFKVPAAEKGELLAALGPLAPQIVENPSTATGTALPDAFKPAPPLTVAATPPMMPQKTLYERLGGQPAVEAVVKDFAERVLADARINKKFAKSNAPRLVKNLTDFVCSATGGPCKYTGLSMKQSHLNMGTTQGEFAALVEDLVMTLDKFKVPEKEKAELLGALGPLAPQIVENPSTATGTALPDAFKPAPPLGGATATATPAPTPMNTGATVDPNSLYARLGGQAAIEAVVKDFAERVLADPRIKKKFAKSNAPRLLKNLTDFVCSATGGPCKYTGLSMTQSHKNMGTTQGEFNALVEDLAATLDKFKVPAKERSELLNALAPLAPQIVERKGNNSTGNDLPAAFKPAPPLKP